VLKRYAIKLRDILANPPDKTFRWLVCVEVLEHLEDPKALLAGLYNLLALGGHAFVAVAINAASRDHIYLYRNADEVSGQLRAAGVLINQHFIDTAEMPASLAGRAPGIAAFIVAH
jgi:2-polyprenyl-3-methyl-5-hydroxy-6-metoxy-1,4-benzoquinol methylase